MNRTDPLTGRVITEGQSVDEHSRLMRDEDERQRTGRNDPSYIHGWIEREYLRACDGWRQDR